MEIRTPRDRNDSAYQFEREKQDYLAHLEKMDQNRYLKPLASSRSFRSGSSGGSRHLENSVRRSLSGQSAPLSFWLARIESKNKR